MRNIPPSLQSHLDRSVTTLCWCWRLDRTDGQTLGFTDHDRAITFGGVVFSAESGFSSSEMRQAVGLQVDNLEVESALRSDALDEADLAAGLYDGAEVTIYRVSWENPVDRFIARRGTIGEVRRGGEYFSAEIRGLSDAMQHPRGRIFQHTCDADLGDARCGVNLNDPAFKGSGVVAAVHDQARFTVSGLESFSPGWFEQGLLRWENGPNTGSGGEVKSHLRSGGFDLIETWQMASREIMPGDAVAVTAGCDKRFATCRERFQNSINFQGFPHMPGTDFLVASPDNSGNSRRTGGRE